MEFYDSSQIPTDLAKRSFSAGITRIMPNGSAPLFALSGMAKKKTALQIEHGYWSKSMIYPAVKSAAGVSASATTIADLDNTDGIVVGTLLRNQSVYAGGGGDHATLAETMLVTAINSSTSITVERGFAGTTAKVVAAGGELQAVGTAFEQGSEAPRAVAVTPSRILNNTQIFRNAWGTSNTLAAIKMEVGDGATAENKRDCGAFHAQDIEKATFFGTKSSGTRNGRPFTTMNGIEALIYEQAANNLKQAGATTNYAQLEAMLNPLFDYTVDGMHGNVRTLFVGGNALQVINEIGRLSGSYQIMDGQTSFGLQFKQFKTSRGTFNMIEHPLFNTNNDWKSMAVAMDLSSFDFAYLAGRDTMHTSINSKGQATNGKDEEAGVLTSELTIELKNPMACGILYNLRAAA